MRKIDIVTLILLFTFLQTSAQVSGNSKDRNRFGIRGGINYSSLINEPLGNFSPGIGFQAGAFYYLVSPSNKKFLLPMELMINYFSSSKDPAKITSISISNNYVANVYLNKNLYLEPGITISYFPSNNLTVSGSTVNISDELPFDVGLIGGIGYEFNNRMLMSLRYSYGLFPSNTTALFIPTYSSFSLSLGYSF